MCPVRPSRRPETVPRQSERPSRIQTDRGDSTECRREFGDPDSVLEAPYDELAPDTEGTPAYRYISITAMRYLGVDGQTGTELARRGLASDPQDAIPDLTALGFDNGDIDDRPNGGQSFTRVRATDANLFLSIEYGGGNSGAKPRGIPVGVSHTGALRLLTDAADRRPCPTPEC